MKGSPAAIASMIHKAAQRQAVTVNVQGSVTTEADLADAIAKAKNDTADRKHKAATGAAMPDGSYPIADVGDLTKAIHAVGRGGSSHGAIRKHIISRARSLGASSKIPDNWNSDGSLKGDSVSKTDAVAKDMGPELDEGVDGLDPTIPLAAPDDDCDAPGDPTDPGSPAWEAIDAATAVKWTSILARARVAVDMLAEREMLEAASADPDDMENAFCMQDVCCAIDYAISMLAPFAVAEQSAADCGEADMMAMVGKATAADPGAAVLHDVTADFTAVRKAMESADLSLPLAQIETFGALIAKSGRVLSSVNEAHIREAAGRLNTVLSSLPQAPAIDDGQPVAKEKETTVAETDTQDAAGGQGRHARLPGDAGEEHRPRERRRHHRHGGAADDRPGRRAARSTAPSPRSPATRRSPAGRSSSPGPWSTCTTPPAATWVSPMRPRSSRRPTATRRRPCRRSSTRTAT